KRVESRRLGKWETGKASRHGAGLDRFSALTFPRSHLLTSPPGQLVQFLADMLRRELYLLLIAAFQGQQGHARDRRILQLFAEFNFLFVKPGEVVPARVLNRRMKRREGLH